MDIDYNDSERAQELGERARRFMDEQVIPAERERPPGETLDDDVIADLREKARDYDIYAPQISEEYGGMGESFRDCLTVFEQAGRSLLGAPAMRVDAPDEGNIHTLEVAANEEQKERWIPPLVEGEIRSAYSMTEPFQGGGADPKMLRTTAEKDGDEWVINGHKWWTSYASHADIMIVMAVTDPDAHPYEGCSMFLVPTDTPGVNIERDVPCLGEEPWGHAEIYYEDCRVPAENLMGEKNQGFTIAQQRLGPARLTHCMRFSGMAQRAISVAKAYMDEREAFGGKLSGKQSLRFDLAECEMKLHAVRTMSRHAAHQVSRGKQARTEVSMCKVFVANTIQDIIDQCLQVCGSQGIAHDLPIAEFYESVRQFRIYDGPDEVHKRVIARKVFEEIDPAELEQATRY